MARVQPPDLVRYIPQMTLVVPERFRSTRPVNGLQSTPDRLTLPFDNPVLAEHVAELIIPPIRVPDPEAVLQYIEFAAKVDTIRAKVWIEATEDCRPYQGCPPAVPYAYPVAQWRFSGFDQAVKKPIRVEISAADSAIPAYATKYPYVTAGNYRSAFDSRWQGNSPPTHRKGRIQAEAARWHIVDRFLGPGINLSYGGGLDFDGERVHVVVIDDVKYGPRYEAYFSTDTHLLVATREELSHVELMWWRYKHNRIGPPVWTTRYERYAQVGAVLLPDRISRSEVRILLNLAANGNSPSEAVPEIE